MINIFVSLLAVSFLFLSEITFAATSSKNDEAPLTMIYPELHVVPKATERLKMEVKKERSSKWSQQIPMQVAALSTMVAAGYASGNQAPTENDKINSDHKLLTSLSMAVGGAWLATTVFLATSYDPYESAWNEVGRLGEKTMEDQITKERLAEEGLARPSTLGKKLLGLSLATNITAIMMANTYTNQNSKMMGLLSLALNFSPLLFPYTWMQTYEQHLDYKKKIYAPIAMGTLIPDSQNHYHPGVLLTWRF